MFNITDFLIWQMATTFSLNGDTGAHNMYLHGPTAGVEQSDALDGAAALLGAR